MQQYIEWWPLDLEGTVDYLEEMVRLHTTACSTLIIIYDNTFIVGYSSSVGDSCVPLTQALFGCLVHRSISTCFRSNW